MDQTAPENPASTAVVDGEVAGQARPKGRAVAITSVVGLLLGGGAMFYVVRRLVKDWPDASEALSHADLRWVGVAMVLAILAMSSIGWGWRYVMQILGVRVPIGRVVAWYFVGEMGKYLPGGHYFWNLFLDSWPRKGTLEI